MLAVSGAIRTAGRLVIATATAYLVSIDYTVTRRAIISTLNDGTQQEVAAHTEKPRLQHNRQRKCY